MEGKGEHPQNNIESAPRIPGLEIKRYRDFEQVKVYGNVPPEEVEHWYIDEYSIKTSTNNRDILINSIKRHPEELPEIINKLVNTGVYFESIKYVVPMDKGEWTDGELSSRVVTEVMLAIGKDALPYLKENKEKYAKDMARKINREIMNKKIDGMFKSLLPRKK